MVEGPAKTGRPALRLTRRRRVRPRIDHRWWGKLLVETAFMTVAVIALESSLGHGLLGSYGQHPHPYWIIVLTMAASRGTVAAILASVCASIPYLIGALLVLAPEHWFDVLTIDTLKEPLLFLGVGFLVGELRDGLTEQQERLNRRVLDLEHRNRKLRREREVLSEANLVLEARLVDHSLQFDNLLDIASRLDDAEGSDVFEITLDLLDEHCGGSASVWRLTTERELVLVSQRGWGMHPSEFKVEEVRSSPYVARAIREGLPVNGLSPIETPPKIGPLLVAPLTDASGSITYVLCLDEIPSKRLNESTAATFFGIADWIASALSRMAQGEAAQSAKTVWKPSFSGDTTPVLRVEGTAHLGERLRLEVERQARYDVVGSVLAFYVEPLKSSSLEGREATNDAVEREVARHLRSSDGIYELGPRGAYAIVLGGTSIEGARGTEARLGRRLTELPGSLFSKARFLVLPILDLDGLATQLHKWGRTMAPSHSSPPLAIHKPRQVLSAEDFRQRIQVEIAMGRRCGFNIHLVVLFGERASEESDHALAGDVEAVMETLLRPTDGAYSLDPHRCVLVLPSTGAEQASILAHRIEGALAARHDDPSYGRVHSIFFGIDPCCTHVSEVTRTVQDLSVAPRVKV